MSTDTRQRFPPSFLLKSASDFAQDFLELGELQLKLLGSDATDAARQARPALLAAGLAVGVGLGSVPVLLIALALGLSAVNVPLPLAFLMAAFIGLGGTAGLLYAAYRRLHNSGPFLEVSRLELRNNMDWLKHVLANAKQKDE